MKFDDTLKKMYKIVLEADAPQAQGVPPPDDQSMTAGPGPIAPGNNADAAAPADGNEDSGAMTPQGEVMLIRLIAKALTVKPSAEDLISVVGLKDINETNAKEVLNKLIGIIRSYSDVSGI